MNLSLQAMNIQEEIRRLKNIKAIEELTSNFEKGDLTISQLIQFGFILYGPTRAGKTSMGHLLSGNPLRGRRINGEDMVETSTSRNNKAKISHSMNSETMIPNSFKVKFPCGRYSGVQTWVIDTPGYGDTYGVLRIFANGFYHYQLYSKVKNIKFILCFDYSNIQNTSQRFIETIREFTASFKDYLNNPEEIWKSCCFLFTKTPDSETIKDDIKTKLTSIVSTLKSQMDQRELDVFKKFVSYIVQEDRIFNVKRYKNGETTNSTGMLRQIDDKVTDWWSRDMNPLKPNQVDMGPIKFALSKQIYLSTLKEEKSREEFIELISYYNLRVKEFVEGVNPNTEVKDKCSLDYILHELAKDAMVSPESHNFQDVIQTYNNQYFGKLDPLYQQERQKLWKDLFGSQVADLSRSVVTNGSKKKSKFRERSYIEKKHECLKLIEKIKVYIYNEHFEDRSLDWLEKCEEALYKIVRELIKACYKRKQAIEVYKYGYLVHRFISEARIFFLLTEVFSTTQYRKRLRQASNNQTMDIFRPLKDVMGVEYTYKDEQIIQCYFTAEKLHELYIKKFDIKDPKYKGLIINQSLIDFFSSISITEQNVAQKITDLIFRFSEQVLSESQNKIELSLGEKYKLIKRLILSRINTQELYALSQIEDQKRSYTFMIRKLTKNAGRLLANLGKYDLARRVYATVKYVSSTVKLYQTQLNLIKKNQILETGRLMTLLIEYGKYLSDNGLQTKAIDVLQEAFELSEDYESIQGIKKNILDTIQRCRQKTHVSDYERSLFDDRYFQPISEDLDTSLCQLCQLEGSKQNIVKTEPSSEAKLGEQGESFEEPIQSSC